MVAELISLEGIMMPNFKQLPQAPSQMVLVPVSLEDSLPANCDARLLSEAMELLDWSPFEISYSHVGCPAYPPKQLAKLLVYGYSKGIRSSRRLEEAAKFDSRYMYLAGGLHPDHATIARFRRQHEAHLKALFVRTVQLCDQADLVLLNTVAVDGTKIQARASKRSLYDEKRLAKEQAVIDRIFAEAESADQADEAQDSGPSDGLPKELHDPKVRKAKLAEIAKRLRETGDKSVSATEADCKVMKTTAGLRPAYNVQLSVDAERQVIVAAEVNCQQADAGLLPDQIEQVKENLGRAPDLVLADGGYSDEDTFHWLKDNSQDALIPPREQPQKKHDNTLFSAKCFLADETQDALVCPAGRKLSFSRIAHSSSGNYKVYTAANCRDCSFFHDCVKPPSKKGRSVWVSVVAQRKAELRQRLKTPAGKARYLLRQQTVEPVIGNQKANRMFRRFGLPGKVGAAAEIWLLFIGHNLAVWVKKQLGVLPKDSTKSRARRKQRKLFLFADFWRPSNVC